MSEVSVRQILAALLLLAVAGSHDAMTARRKSPGRPAANSSTVKIAHFGAASGNNTSAQPPSLKNAGDLSGQHSAADRTVPQGAGTYSESNRVSHASMNTHPTEYRTRL